MTRLLMVLFALVAIVSVSPSHASGFWTVAQVSRSVPAQPELGAIEVAEAEVETDDAPESEADGVDSGVWVPVGGRALALLGQDSSGHGCSLDPRSALHIGRGNPGSRAPPVH